MKKFAFLKYQGSKIRFLEDIYNILNKTQKKIYVEPFLGGGSVFFNLEKEFDRYIINDIDENMIQIYKTFQTCSLEEFNDVERDAKLRDIKNSKEGYYAFRETVNECKGFDDTYYGLGLYFLINSCINSMARFGPSGFNQAFGNRFKTLSNYEFLMVQERLQKAEIYNLDFFDLLKKINIDQIENDCLLFLDPPYIERKTSYKTISNTFFDNLMNFINETNSDILYTDIDHSELKLDKITLRETMVNTSPTSNKEETGNKEVMFFKIKDFKLEKNELF